MTNAYNAIVTFEGDNFQDYLDRLFLFTVFEEIFKEYPDIEICKKIIKFIAWSYSMDSDMLLMQGNSWNKVAPEIFKRAKLPDELYNDVCLLENVAVLETVDQWLRHQNDENWMNYITFRNLRSEMLLSSLSDIKTANGTETNYEQKMKNAIHSVTLLQMMNDAKETFIQNHPKLKGSVEAFNKVNDKVKVTRNVGSYAI